MKPSASPVGAILSEMGRRVLDLNLRGFSNVQIARHCGCHHEQIRRLVDDPNLSPRHTTGQALIGLHENVMTGISTWGRMVEELRHQGFTYEQIAQTIGTGTDYLRDRVCKNPSIIPNHDIGQALVNFYRRVIDK